ncbi:MAG: terpene cyclase/mutase family protein [Verrucomicrobia bacterium]|nr:terpene cyclase/mutase family protein [Verrucomicrobiota bacterium]MCH8510081.1 terpene cyclase/mutase family protein [Kiritimatiellia bacterium]
MKYQTRNRIEHGTSFFISVVVNSVLLVAMLHFITMEPDSSVETTTVMVIDEDEFVELDPIEEEEIIEEPLEREEFVDVDMPTFETEIDTSFDLEPEVVETPTDTNVNELSNLLSDIVSPVQMTNLMPGRTTAARQAALNRYAGGRGGQTEASVQRALQWLARVQRSDGSWGKGATGGSGNAGYTGLALLTFLSNGQTPSSADYGRTVTRAIRYLVEDQGPDGKFRSGREVYAHPMATYALAEAYTMTNNRLLREPLLKAARVIIEGQMADGGFPGPGNAPTYVYGGGGNSDNSVNAWHVQCMKALEIASRTHNLEIPGLARALDKAMDGMLLLSRQRDNTLTFGYTSPGERHILTAAGGLALQFTGRGNSRNSRHTLNSITQHSPPEWGNSPNPSEYGGTINLWYYAIQALFHNDPDGRAFREYNRGMAEALITNQHEEGYWDCFSDRGRGQGPVYNTTLAALSLMVYYRYLPTTQADQIQARPPQREQQVEDDDMIRITL